MTNIIISELVRKSDIKTIQELQENTQQYLGFAPTDTRSLFNYFRKFLPVGIEGFEKYYINEDAVIYNSETGNLIKGWVRKTKNPDENKWPITLDLHSKTGVRKGFMLARLVYATFISDDLSSTIKHLDGLARNNHVSNLASNEDKLNYGGGKPVAPNIKGFSRYWVSAYGTIINLTNGREFKGSTFKGRTFTTLIDDNDIQHYLPVDAIVLYSRGYLNSLEGCQSLNIKHLDGNIKNNIASNLEILND